MSDLPTPKYRVGQKVFTANVTETIEDLPCPDCLGSKKWKVINPAGAEFEIDCQRCARPYYRSAVPKKKTFVGYTKELTVGLVTAKSSDTWKQNRDLVEYMCSETGLGSGSIYYESLLFATEEEAKIAADSKAALMISNYVEMESTQKLLHNATLSFEMAGVSVAEEATKKVQRAAEELIDQLFERYAQMYGDDASKVQRFLRHIDPGNHFHDYWNQAMSDADIDPEA